MEGTVTEYVPFPLKKAFDDAEPFYLAIGMTHEQYWDDDPTLTVIFKRAHELRNEMDSQRMWMQGVYNFEAFSTALSNFSQVFDSKHKRKPTPYRNEPLRVTPLTQEEKERKAEQERQKIIDHFTKLQKRLEAKNKEVTANGNG